MGGLAAAEPTDWGRRRFKEAVAGAGATGARPRGGIPDGGMGSPRREGMVGEVRPGIWVQWGEGCGYLAGCVGLKGDEITQSTDPRMKTQKTN